MWNKKELIGAIMDIKGVGRSNIGKTRKTLTLFGKKKEVLGRKRKS